MKKHPSSSALRVFITRRMSKKQKEFSPYNRKIRRRRHEKVRVNSVKELKYCRRWIENWELHGKIVMDSETTYGIMFVLAKKQYTK